MTGFYKEYDDTSGAYVSSAEDAAAAALVSKNAAAASATAAAASEVSAGDQATAASLSQTNSATSETNAATSAINAESAKVSAESARDSAAADSVSAESAKVSAETAKVSAESARDTAVGSATTATTQAGIATTSATNAAASYDDFDDRYLGAKSSNPSTDNDGDALVTGALYFNTTTNDMKVWSGSAWLNAYAPTSGTLAAANNLSDLDNAATARTNLGLGTAATTAASDYATAAQGTKVDGIEAGADVTDTANVTAAGAVMDSELTSEASVKALNQGVATTDSPTFAAINVNGLVTSDDFQIDLGTATATSQITTPSALSGFQAFSIKNTHTEGYLTFGTTLGEARIQAMGVNGSADPLNIDVGQTTAIGIDATGKVGINTSAPEATLHIADIGSTGPALHIAGGSNTEGDITTPHTENLQIGHWNESTDTFTQRVEIDTSGNMSISKALFLKSPNDAHQRVDGRDSDTTESRAHWYGVDSSGGTQNFRHAWYDGSSYVNVDVNNGGVGFNGYLKAIRLYSNTAGTTGYFFNDSGTRTAYAGGDFYIQSSVGNCYIYATTTYLGNTSGDNILTRGNLVRGDHFEFGTSGGFRINAGYGSRQFAYGVRAWARYEMSGTHSFRDDEGFSSVTDIGTGRSRLNFTNTMPNTYYSVQVTAGSTSYTNAVCAAQVYSTTTSSFSVDVEDLDSGFTDRDNMHVMVVR